MARWTGDKLRAGCSIDYASSNPSFLVGLADNWGTESSGYSTNGGQTWTTFSKLSTGRRHLLGERLQQVRQPISSGRLRVVFSHITLSMGARAWNPITLPGVSSWSAFDWSYNFDTRTVTADRVLANTFYLYYAGQGVFETTNGGASWTKVFSGQISASSQYNASNSNLFQAKPAISSLPADGKAIMPRRSNFIDRQMGEQHGQLFPMLLKYIVSASARLRRGRATRQYISSDG